MKAKINKKHSDVLIEIVNKAFQADVMSPVRRMENTDGRRAFCAILRNEGHSCSRIADVLNKHHATVVHYTKTIEGILKTDPAFAKRYDKASMIFLKEIEESSEDYVSEAINNLKDKITSEQSKASILTREVKRLEHLHLHLNKRNELINDKLKGYNENFEKLYDIISLRTKPNTEEFIQRKLNTFYNGVYSEEIICY